MAVASAPARRAQPAFRIKEEHAGGDDLLTLPQAGSDLHAVGQLHTERDRPRLEPVARRDEDVLLLPGVNDGITRHREYLVPR